MVERPTIKTLATTAGVSVSTVNRVINNPESVRATTRDRVLHTAERIGFYGLGSIEHSIRRVQETHRLGILLQQGGRAFYRNLGVALQQAARQHPQDAIDLKLEFLDDLSPDNVSKRLMVLGDTCDSVALVAAEHPLISDAIDMVLRKGVPVCGLIAPLTANGNVGFVGLDNWKVGRTAAWAFHRMSKAPGKIGILVGNHRYRNQDLNESGFRSYFREHNAGFTLLEPRATHESSAVAREMTEQLFKEHPDMGGLFVSGGGITGALAALSSQATEPGFVTVGYELFEATRLALIDGTMTMAISHPMDRLAQETIAAMIKAKQSGLDNGAQTIHLPFDIYTSENL